MVHPLMVQGNLVRALQMRNEAPSLKINEFPTEGLDHFKKERNHLNQASIFREHASFHASISKQCQNI